MAEEAKKREEIRAEDVCVCMHTALRKCCDSKITSAAYSLIHLICSLGLKPDRFNPWILLGQLVADKLNATPPTPPVAALRRIIASNALETAFYAATRENKKELPDGATTAMWALQSTLACFSDTDLDGIVTYLTE